VLDIGETEGVRATWRRLNWDGLLVSLILALSLAVRLQGLDVFLTADELKWTCRSINFRTALARGDLAGTFQVGHPGVITMWAGTLSLLGIDPADWREACEETRISRLAVAVGSQRLAELARFLFAARRPVAALTWLTTVVMVLLAARVFGRHVAPFAALLVGFDPFYLGLSRVLHLDALVAGFMLVSLLALLTSVGTDDKRPTTKDERRTAQGQRPFVPGRWLFIVSGLAAGLAFLNKSPALFLGPFSVAVMVVFGLRNRAPVRAIVRDLTLWNLAAGLTCLALWPALWVNPISTVQAVLDKALGYAAEGHENLNFFLGQITNDPGPAFYLIAWAFRTTPLVWLGLAAALIAPMVRPFRAHSALRSLATLLLYAALFTLFMTTGAKKFDRYLIPAFLPLDVLAAVGLAQLVQALFTTVRRLWRWLVIAAVGVLQLGLVLPYAPYYLSFYNPLLGGPAGARQALLIGWGEGLDQAARYLNAKPGAADLHVATRHLSDFAPLFVGATDSLEDYNPAITDYFVFYVGQIQRRLSADVLDRYLDVEVPEHVVRMFGVDYAWIYANADHKPVADYLARHADPAHEAILLNGPSRFQAAYAGPLPVYVVDGERDETVVAGLQAASTGRRRLWYLTYPRADNDPLRLIQHQLDTHTWQAESQDFPTSRLTAYDLPEPPTFRVPQADQPADLTFDGRLRLRGFGLDPAPAQFGRGLSIALDWEALQPPGEDLSAFIHLVDEVGHLWGQGDKQIFGAGRPTSLWEAGETHLDRYALRVLPGTPPGRYQLKFGVYRTADNRRLAFTDPAGAVGTEWLLGTIEVAPSPRVPSLEELGMTRLAPSSPLPLVGEGVGGEGGRSPFKLIGLNVPGEVHTGEALSVTLFWEVVASLNRDYLLRLSLVTANDHPLADATFPPAGQYPTWRWRPSERLRGQLDLPVPADALGGPVRLRLQFVDAAGQSAGPPLDVAQVNVVAVERRFTLPVGVQHRLNVRLGDQIVLAGYDLEIGGEASPQYPIPNLQPPTGTLYLTLYWQALARPDHDYTVFVHLLDASGQIRAQVDRMPADGTRPTSGWVPGEVLIDRYEVSLSPDTPAGRYRLVVGMYDPATLQRLPAIGADGQRLPDDRVLLEADVQVAP